MTFHHYQRSWEMYVFSRENKFLRTKGGLWYSFPALQEADSLLGIQTCESCEETSSLFFFFLNLSFANLRNRKAELELQTLKCMKSNFKISASGILSWFPENLVFFPLCFWSTLCFSSVQFSLVAQLCPTLCDPMNHSMPGLPVHHQLLEFTQTVHQVDDAIQPSHPLSSPSPPAPKPSQHQNLFQWVNSSHEVAKVFG